MSDMEEVAVVAQVAVALEEEDRPLTEEELRMSKYWFALAAMLGYNELAKLGKTLGEKVFFRMFREDWSKHFVDFGGNADVFTHEDSVINISVPYANLPHLRFRAEDVELMRDYVYEHDKKQRAL